MQSYHTVETPSSAPGAIAMIRVVHDDPESLGLLDPAPGRVLLGQLWGIDEGVILRLDQHAIMLMPHGGMAIVRAISEKLDRLGVPHEKNADPQSMYPEASTQIEAWMLWVMSRAASPLAVDILLAQPERWGTLGVQQIRLIGESATADGRVLGRLITPPIVVAVGRANVGKSTLINALVGEHVALVADNAGTTRDHVGVLVDLGGLVVRWIDTPGIDERISDGEEIQLAQRVIARADLVVHCIDSCDDLGTLDDRIHSSIASGCAMIRLGTRSDLGGHDRGVDSGVDLRVSLTNSGQSGGGTLGLEALVEQVKESLVSAQVLQDPRPWAFWADLDRSGDLGLLGN